MGENSLVIQKYDGDDSPWVIADKMIEMAYQAIKNSYSKGAPRRIEFKLLTKRLKFELDTQRYKFFTGDVIYLNFSSFDDREMEWFINCFETYLEEINFKKIFYYQKLIDDLREQIKKED